MARSFMVLVMAAVTGGAAAQGATQRATRPPMQRQVPAEKRGGWQGAHWGMNPAQVLRLFPTAMTLDETRIGAEHVAKGCSLQLRAPPEYGGLHTVDTKFCFASEKLTTIVIRTDASDAWIRKVTQDAFGAPNDQTENGNLHLFYVDREKGNRIEVQGYTCQLGCTPTAIVYRPDHSGDL